MRSRMEDNIKSKTKSEDQLMLEQDLFFVTINSQKCICPRTSIAITTFGCVPLFLASRCAKTRRDGQA